MKPTDFAYYLTDFLSKYLPGIAGLSSNTIMSYRDNFCLFLAFCSENKKIKPEKFSLNHLNRKLIEEYLEWLEKTRDCIASTRNVRLAAFHSFCRYLQMEFPDYILPAQHILSIPMKRTKKISVEYITLEAMKLLLGKPDKMKKSGRRDMVLLSLLYDSGARVQELSDLKAPTIKFSPQFLPNKIPHQNAHRFEFDYRERYLKPAGPAASQIPPKPKIKRIPPRCLPLPPAAAAAADDDDDGGGGGGGVVVVKIRRKARRGFRLAIDDICFYLTRIPRKE